MHRYRRGERAAAPGGPLNDYELLRRRVLFEVWFPGEQEVVLRARVCKSCGLVAYAPRPSATDLDAKYEFLGRFERTGASDPSEAGALMDRERAARTRDAADEALGREATRVLDFGGGDGKLLAPFLERGAEGAVIDHNRKPLPGVTRLGATLDDAQADGSYDAIIASHVLEHLAGPASALRALRGFIAPEGVIVSEVPLEVWKGAPIARDPVTHVNFFTTGTLAELHERSGWRIVDARALRGSYADARKEVAVVVAGTGGGPPSITKCGAEEAERLLDPGIGTELTRAWRSRRIPSARGVARRLGLVRGERA